MTKLSIEQRIKNTYGYLPGGTAISQYEACLEKEIKPSDKKAMTFDRNDTSEWRKARLSLKRIEEEMVQKRITKAKQWLKDKDMSVWKNRYGSEETYIRYDMIHTLHKKFELSFKQIEQVLTEASGVKVGESGIRFIWRKI